MLNAGQKLTFNKLPVVIKAFILAIFECPFYIGFTACPSSLVSAFTLLMHNVQLMIAKTKY